MTETSSPLGDAGVFALLVTIATAVALWSLGGVATDGLIGWDAYPLIAAADGGVGHAFTTELMDGRYPDGRFYRPLVTLTFAMDAASASGSLDAGAYRLMDVLACAVGAAFAGLFVARVAQERAASAPKALAAGAVCALAVVLHRAQLDIVPFAPRRADGMCAAALAAAAYLAYRGAKPWALGLAALTAILSKETGVLVVPLVAAATWARPRPEDATSSALRDSLLATAVPIAALILAFIARFAVLGELGGHAETGLSLDALLTNAKVMGLSAGEGAPGGALVLAALLGFTMFRAVGLDAGRVLVLPILWAAGAIALTSLAGRSHEWYALHLVTPIALVAGVGVAAGLTHGTRSALGAALVGAGLLGLVAAGGRAPQRRALLDHASAVAADQVTRFSDAVAGLAEGDRATVAPYFFAASSRDGAQVFLHAPYSLAALAELLRDNLGVEVRGPGFESTREVQSPRATVELSAPVVRGM